MDKNKNTMETDVRASVGSLYADLLKKRQNDRATKEEEKRIKKETKKSAETEEQEEKPELSKKEKRQAEMDAWKEVIIGLTGDDLEYAKPKKSKKKYKKWIGEEDELKITTEKPKKIKKKNYNKEFEPELNMLKSIVADQNKFTQDLQKRFQNAAGPATKDAMPLNKAMVDLAANINTSRSNSLGMLKAIGDLKRTIADLYMKQKKLEADMGGGGSAESTDLGLMGSGIASSLFGDFAVNNPAPINNTIPQPNNTPSDFNYTSISSTPVTSGVSTPSVVVTTTQVNTPSTPVISDFDPSQWDGPDLGNSYVNYESIPHDVVVEWHKNDNVARFKAVRSDTGEELPNCPVPETDPSKLKFNESNLTVKGEFDEIYKLEIV
jgi:hypothetical protein